MAGVGKKSELKVWRDGRMQRLSVVLTEFPQEIAQAGRPGSEKQGELGLVISDLTSDIKRELGTSHKNGVVVKSNGGAADKAGLRPGDVILFLNNRPINSVRQFSSEVEKTKKVGYLRLKVGRAGWQLFSGCEP
ncbi:MAG: PDZ domain-containing protein [Myxococcota bacterium]